jgi:hypothetical protein
VNVYGWNLSGKPKIIVTELMERGSLDSVLKHDDANEFSWPLKGHTVALDCLRGLVELHFRFTVPICHLGKSLFAEKSTVFCF